MSVCAYLAMKTIISLLFGSVLLIVLVISIRNRWPGNPDQPSSPSYKGLSEGLNRTVVLPTLLSPIPVGKSVIWCASFQKAWNSLRAFGGGGAIVVANAGELADLLNRTDSSADDIPENAYYAAAAPRTPGFFDNLGSEMGTRFPGVPLPEEVKVPADGVVSYSYLTASVPFQHPYDANPKPLVFDEAQGNRTPVDCFGLKAEKEDDEKRAQVKVLFSDWDEWYQERRAKKPRDVGHDPPENPEFALDLCQESMPSQVILARVKREKTLAETLRIVCEKVAHRSKGVETSLTWADIVLVPTINFEIHHHFRELEGRDKIFTSGGPLQGLFLASAIQSVQLRLDRSGATILSSAGVAVGGGRPPFAFNGPFLLCLQKRGAQQPYFVMWVDNAELLQKGPVTAGSKSP
jgi:hypothetical protein